MLLFQLLYNATEYIWNVEKATSVIEIIKTFSLLVVIESNSPIIQC